MDFVFYNFEHLVGFYLFRIMDILFLFFLSLPLSLLGFVFEIYPRLLNRKFGVDIWTHLLYLKEYHRQKGIPKKIENGFLVPGTYDYPPIFIFIISKFPFKLIEKYEFIFSPFFDALHLILIFFISYYLIDNILLALLTQALYILTPIIVLENSSTTPRSLGYTLFTILFLSLFLFIQNGNYLLLTTAITAGTFIFLSHRFTTQGFLFFSIFFSILDKNIIYFGIFMLSFVLAIIISRGFYLRVLRGHIGNLIFWRQNIKYRFAHQIKGNYKEHKTQDFVFKLYNQFLKFPPFVLTITNPWILPVFYILFFSYPGNPIMQQMVWWVIFSCILVFFTTWIPSLRFLGEPQRYLELSAFPVAFLSAWFFTKVLETNFAPIGIVYYISISIASLITIIVIQRKAIVKDRLRTITPEIEKMFDYLNTLKVKPRLLCIPHQITTNTIYHTGCPVFVNADYTNIEKISEVYPYLRKPIKKIMEKYQLDAVLLNEDYATINDLELKNYQIEKRMGNFVLLKVLS